MNESLRALLDDDARPPTVGERFDAAGRAALGRRLAMAASVDRRLAPVLHRAEELAGLFAGRFDRVESPAERLPEIRPADRAGRPRWVATRPAGPHLTVAGGEPGAAAGAARSAPATPGRELPADVRSRLRDTVGPGAEALRVHDDTAADGVARAHGADAVTVGSAVLFRDGRYRPDEPAGFGLLAHEATHVTAWLAGSGPSGAGDGGDGGAAEEFAALAQERAAHRSFATARPAPGAGHPPAARPPSPVGIAGSRGATAPPVPAGSAGPHPVAVPRAADVDRDLAQPAPFDVEELRRGLITDVMRRLRSDFERGG